MSNGSIPVPKNLSKAVLSTFQILINECRENLLKDTKFLRYLCLFLSQKAIGNTFHYSKSQSYPLEICLANFILLTSCNQMYREKHTEVAEFWGVTYRHLLYVLANFVKRGYLKKLNKDIIFKT